MCVWGGAFFWSKPKRDWCQRHLLMFNLNYHECAIEIQMYQLYILTMYPHYNKYFYYFPISFQGIAIMGKNILLGFDHCWIFRRCCSDLHCSEKYCFLWFPSALLPEPKYNHQCLSLEDLNFYIFEWLAKSERKQDVKYTNDNFFIFK